MQGSKRDSDIKNRLLNSVGEGKGEMVQEKSTETCALSYGKQMTSANLMHEAGHPEPVHCGSLEGQGEEGGGKRPQDGGDTCILMADSC